MRPSIKRHIFQQFFALSLLTIVALIGLLEILTDDLEKSMVALELESEQAHYLSMVSDVPQSWITATTLAAFVPTNTENFSELPTLFQGLPTPFSGEIETANEDYWVNISLTPDGILYIAKGTYLFEQREEVFLFGIMVIGILFITVSFVLTQLSARRIVKPLTALTEEISNIDPRQRTMRVSEEYYDQELYSIASTFNTYINTMEEYVKREQMLIGMASHELRTPIAVISGALDVLDQHGSMSEKDRKTLLRIRDASSEMHANVEAILILARKQSSPQQASQVLLSESIQSVVQERISAHPHDQSRISIAPGEIDHDLVGDASLIRMLLRNLIQNALEHTQGKVTLQQNKQGLMISDEGIGLPENARLQLSWRVTPPPSGQKMESGLGLFIVTLICERLGWRIGFDDQAESGTHLQLYVISKPTA